jgi:hypothetical protein
LSPNIIPIAWLLAAVLATAIIATATVVIVVTIKAPQIIARWPVLPGSIIRLSTIVAIIFVLVLLCADGKVSGEATVATLSAIAGYVLGSERRAAKGTEASPTSN